MGAGLEKGKSLAHQLHCNIILCNITKCHRCAENKTNGIAVTDALSMRRLDLSRTRRRKPCHYAGR